MRQTEFDLEKGREARDKGLTQVEDNAPGWVERARAVAREISRLKGEVTADDVRRVMEERGDYPHHPNAWGAVFKGKGWNFAGRLRPSRAVSRHSGLQRVWKWTGESP